MWNVETGKNYWYWINEKYFPIYHCFNDFALHVEKEKNNKYKLILAIRGKVIDSSELIFEDEETISEYEDKKNFDKLWKEIRKHLTLQMFEKKESIIIIPEQIYISHIKSLCFKNIWVYKYKWARWTKVKVNTIKGKYFVLWEWDMIEDSAVDYWSFSHNIFMDVETKEKFIIKNSVFVKIWIPKNLKIGASWKEQFCFTEEDIQKNEDLICQGKYYWVEGLNRFWLYPEKWQSVVIKNKLFIFLFNLCKAKLKELNISNYNLYISEFDYNIKNKYWKNQTIIEFDLNILVDNTVNKEVNEKIYKHLKDNNVHCDSDLKVKCILDPYSDFFCLHDTLFKEEYNTITNIWNYYVIPDASHKSEFNIYMLNQENNKLEFFDNIFETFYTWVEKNWHLVLLYINKSFQLKAIYPLTNEIEVLGNLKFNDEILDRLDISIWTIDEKNFFLQTWENVNHFIRKNKKYEQSIYKIPWVLIKFYYRNSVSCVLETKTLLRNLKSQYLNLKLSSNNFIPMYRFKKVSDNSSDFSVKKYIINNLTYTVGKGEYDPDCFNYRYMRWIKWMNFFSKFDINFDTKFNKLIWKAESLFAEHTMENLSLKMSNFQRNITPCSCINNKCTNILRTSTACLSNNKLSFYASLKEENRIQLIPLPKWK